MSMKDLDIPKTIASVFTSPARNHAPAVITVLLLALIEVIAIFYSGGYYISAMTFCVIAIWMILIILVITGGENVQPPTSKISVALVMLFALFWLWTGISVYWSISPDLSWVEFNRTGGYLGLLIIGTILGRSGISRLLAASLFLSAAAAAALYMIGVKALPSVIDNYENVARVSKPLGYVNATGLMSTFALFFAIYFSAEKKIRIPARLLAGASAMLFLVALFYTQSRGAVFALFFGLLLYFALSPIRIRSLISLIIVSVPTYVIMVWSLGQEAIINDEVELALRVEAAETLRWYFAAGLIFVASLTLLIMYVDKKVTFSDRLVRAVGTTIIIVLAASVTIGATLFTMTREPSFGEWTEAKYKNFTSLGTGIAGVNRLAGIGSSTGRWQIWQEAVDSWQEKPLLGWGAQSFPITHLMLRSPEVGFMKQPHGLPFRLLSELGLVGMALFMSFMTLSIGAATMLIKKLQDRKLKGLAVAMFSTTVIYLVHTSYDWDWNMYALTMPYFLFTGILVGWHESRKNSDRHDDCLHGSPRIEPGEY